MEYSIFKDDNVNATVVRIKKILSKIGIDVTEVLFKQSVSNLPYSCRIHMIESYDWGTNGKGTSSENALASGYAEFMERLQNKELNGFLYKNDMFCYSPNNKLVTIQELKSIYKFFGSYKRFLELNEITKYITIGLGYYFDSTKKSLVVPFYSLYDNKLVYLPIFVIKIISCTNGMCAGNTAQEALVQGLQEICERYALRQVLLKQIVMPDIPLSVFEKYEKLNKIKKTIENNGYEVIVKDASLNQELPVVCVIYKNVNKNLIGIHFGSHLSLPIAIERCFTEFLQNRDINDLGEQFIYKNRNTDKKIYLKNLSERMFRCTTTFVEQNNFVEF